MKRTGPYLGYTLSCLGPVAGAESLDAELPLVVHPALPARLFVDRDQNKVPKTAKRLLKIT